jgi:hypothetical protein
MALDETAKAQLVSQESATLLALLPVLRSELELVREAIRQGVPGSRAWLDAFAGMEQVSAEVRAEITALPDAVSGAQYQAVLSLHAADLAEKQRVIEAELANRVVRLGAWCDLDADGPDDASFDVQEFAVLADGRRLTLHSERGFGLSAPDVWRYLTLESLERDVRTTVLPDDDSEDEHPWEWLAGLLLAQGVAVSPDQLRNLPYNVVFSERVVARLASGGAPLRDVLPLPPGDEGDP